MFLPAPPPAMPWNFQPFAPPPQQPELVPQRDILENRVDYSTRSLDNFNSSHQNCCSRQSNCWSTTPQPANAQAGPSSASPAYPPPVQDYQHVINFQNEADQQASITLQ